MPIGLLTAPPGLATIKGLLAQAVHRFDNWSQARVGAALLIHQSVEAAGGSCSNRLTAEKEDAMGELRISPLW